MIHHTIALLILALAGAPALAQTADSPRTYAVEVDNDAAQLAVRRAVTLDPSGSLTLTPDVRGGLLAPFGATGDPLSTLKPSPYQVIAVQAAYSGTLEAMAVLTEGYTRLLSHKAIDDPNGALASAASKWKKQTDFAQDIVSGSGHVDFGIVRSISTSLKAAFFLAGDSFVYKALGSDGASFTGEAQVALNAGTVWMRKDLLNEFSVFADLKLDGAAKNMFRNGDFTAIPSVSAGAEYARRVGAAQLAGGVEGSESRADAALRPYAKLAAGPASALVAGDFRKSNDAFFPDVIGAGTAVQLSPTPGLKLGVLASLAREKYSMAPAAELDYRAMGTFDLDVNRFLKIDGRARLPDPGPGSPVGVPKLAALGQRVPGEGYQADFMALLKASPTLTDFARGLPVRGVDDILAALSAFTATFSRYDYNHDESGTPNVLGVGNIYRLARQSALAGKQDPILVCIGSSDFVAALAEELGRLNGIPIEAMAVTVKVPNPSAVQGGHAVAAVKTQAYGIVFVDWGKLTPTFTFNTQRALAVFQALVGIPEVAHQITAGPDGHPVGWLFSDDGKVFVRRMTFHDELGAPALNQVFDDAPDGAAIAVERYKNLTRGKF